MFLSYILESNYWKDKKILYTGIIGVCISTDLNVFIKFCFVHAKLIWFPFALWNCLMHLYIKGKEARSWHWNDKEGDRRAHRSWSWAQAKASTNDWPFNTETSKGVSFIHPVGCNVCECSWITVLKFRLDLPVWSVSPTGDWLNRLADWLKSIMCSQNQNEQQINWMQFSKSISLKKSNRKYFKIHSNTALGLDLFACFWPSTYSTFKRYSACQQVESLSSEKASLVFRIEVCFLLSLRH